MGETGSSVVPAEAAAVPASGAAVSTAAGLAAEMARVFLSLGLPATVAADLNESVSDWLENTPPPPTVSAALPPPLRQQLDEFFAKHGEEALLNTAGDVWRNLPWRVGIRGLLPNIAVVELVGPDGIGASAVCRGGVMFQVAGYFYEWHKHAAEEFYAPIGGSAQWFADGAVPAVVAPMSRLIHHRPWQAHAMHTDAAPLLALWLWTGDLSLERYALCPAP